MAEAQARDDGQRKGFFAAVGRFFHGLWVLIRSFFVLLGISMFIIMISTAVIVGHAMKGGERKHALPDDIVLTYTFSPDISEAESGPTLSRPFVESGVVLKDVIDALDGAAKDKRVKGIAARLDHLELSVAQVQELRNAVASFRKAGKFAHIYADSYGEMSAGMKDYYFASAFSNVWLQPVGFVGLTGISMETPFVRGLLDTVGVEPQFGHKGIYKSAPESLTATDMSEPNRMALGSLIADLSDQMVEGIAADRKLGKPEVQALVDNGPYADKPALDAKLVDKLGYYDQMIEQARKDGGLKEDDDTVSLGDYADELDKKGGKSLLDKLRNEVKKEIEKAETEAGEKSGKTVTASKKPVIALIRGVGEIVPSRAGGREGFNSGDIVEAFEDAVDDKSVTAIVFRVDSPGGSPTASETIHRAMMRAREKGKPVVVSMSGYAASGGYWVSTGADKIVAQPGTITGSIGVFGGKFVFAGLWQKLNVNWVTLSQGKNAGMWSFNRPFTEEQFAKFDQSLASIYDSFIKRVVEGRKMTKEQAEAVAEGRAWTGRQAKANGLVDELGGFDRALELAKEAAKIDAKTEVKIVEFPEPKSSFEKFMDLASGQTALPVGIKLDDMTQLMNDALRSETANAPRVR